MTAAPLSPKGSVADEDRLARRCGRHSATAIALAAALAIPAASLTGCSTTTAANGDDATITVAALARRANVSRTFLYQNPEARTLIADAAAAANGQHAHDRADAAARLEASWRERALNAEDALQTTHREISQQRVVIAELLGRIRDLEHDLPDDSVQRVIAENTTLKQRVRQLGQDNQRLTERLQGARDNNRFLDKRVADLEAQLLDNVPG